MFGFELQTNKNVFLSGVKEREVAWHAGDLLTLEGDETYENPDWAELEFVTAPCPDVATARKAVGIAGELARRLAVDAAAAPGGVLTFKQGQAYANGVWARPCTIQIGNPEFHAQPQVTVGVPLAGMRRFITTALRNIDSGALADQLTGLRVDARKRFTDHGVTPEVAESPDMDGFLIACHYFLNRAFLPEFRHFAVDAAGRPSSPRSHDSWRVFEFDSEDLASVSDKQGPVFWTGSGSTCRMSVNRDSPKSRFQLLHRTDFYSMFRMIPQRLRAGVTEEVLRDVLWPNLEWSREFVLFATPYRAEPLDPDAVPPPVERTGRGWQDAEGDSSAKADRWFLAEYGPLFSDWCASIVHGRPVTTGDGNLPKDLASPPPGIRGRERANLHTFPTKDEDKSTYYGMGAFPADSGPQGALAVYEHRAFSTDASIAPLLAGTLVPAANWDALVQRFGQTYLTD